MSPDSLHPPRVTFRQALTRPEVWRRAAPVGVPVGLLQAILNQGDHWLAHTVTPAVVLKTILAPCLTLTVALLSAAATYLEIQRLRSDRKL